MDDVKVAQDAALANVMSAVESALASAPAKRKPDTMLPPAKRQKAPRHMSGLDNDLSSDSDEEPDGDADAGAAGGDAPLQKEVETVDQQETAAKRGNASGSSGSEQEAVSAHSVQVRCAAENSVDCLGSPRSVVKDTCLQTNEKALCHCMMSRSAKTCFFVLHRKIHALWRIPVRCLAR